MSCEYNKQYIRRLDSLDVVLVAGRQQCLAQNTTAVQTPSEGEPGFPLSVEPVPHTHVHEAKSLDRVISVITFRRQVHELQ